MDDVAICCFSQGIRFVVSVGDQGAVARNRMTVSGVKFSDALVLFVDGCHGDG